MVGPARTDESAMTQKQTQQPDKTVTGNYFEDFTLGQEIVHATPRTVTVGDVSLFTALYGPRFAVQSSDAFAQGIGYPRSPIDDLLVFHIVIGKTVPDISRNAIANLGYAEFRFLAPVYPGDTLASVSEVIGVKENSNKKSGTVYVRSTGRNQRGQQVLSYARWVMVNKRDLERAGARSRGARACRKRRSRRRSARRCRQLDLGGYDYALAGSPKRCDDYAVGDKIDHVDGQTIEEAEHQLATRLFQNTARVHFNQHVEGKGRFGRRLVYGGHIISIARALSFNGLANAFHILGAERRAPRGALLCRRHHLCLERGARQSRAAGTGPTWARCACAPSPSRTGPAPTSQGSRPTAATRTASCSTWTIGWRCRARDLRPRGNHLAARTLTYSALAQPSL